MGISAEAEMDALEDLQKVRREIRPIRRNSRLRLCRGSCKLGRARNLLKSMGRFKLAKRFRFRNAAAIRSASRMSGKYYLASTLGVSKRRPPYRIYRQRVELCSGSTCQGPPPACGWSVWKRRDHLPRGRRFTRPLRKGPARP